MTWLAWQIVPDFSLALNHSIDADTGPGASRCKLRVGGNFAFGDEQEAVYKAWKELQPGREEQDFDEFDLAIKRGW